MTDSKEESVSAALEFKQRREQAEKGELITLAGSGLSVRVKRPQIKKLIAMGVIPDNLASFLIRAETEELKPKDLGNLFEMQKIITQQSVFEPSIVDQPDYDKGQISIDDLEDDDLNTVWAWFQGGKTAVEKFRLYRERLSDGLGEPSVSGAQAE